MMHRAEHNGLVHPAGCLGQVFADRETRRTGGDRPELRANSAGSIWLQIEHVLGGRAALQIEQDDVLGLAAAGARIVAALRGEKTGQVERTAQKGEGANGKSLTPRESVAAKAGAAQDGEHLDYLHRPGSHSLRRFSTVRHGNAIEKAAAATIKK